MKLTKPELPNSVLAQATTQETKLPYVKPALEKQKSWIMLTGISL